MNIHWKDWCWSWNSKTLATWCKELTHLKRPWCWERLKTGRKGDGRGWDDGMTSLTRWTWVWASSRSWWWTGSLVYMGSQRVGHNLVTEVNWWFGYWILLHIPVGHMLVFFGKISIQLLSPFLNWVTFFFFPELLSCRSSLYILGKLAPH